MSNTTTPNSDPASGDAVNDSSIIPCISLPKSIIEKAFDAYFQEIKDSINDMTEEFLGIHLPCYQHIPARWDLQRVLVDATGTIVKPHPFLDASKEGEASCSLDRHIYAPVITITLPWNIMASDKRVTFLRDALLHDETYEFRGPHGIPLRHHPVYGQFTVEFTNPVVDLGGSTGTLWCPSTTIYLPDPNTVSDQDFTDIELVNYDTWDQISIWDWAVQCQKARKAFKEQESPQIKDEEEGMEIDGGEELFPCEQTMLTCGGDVEQ
ncbi:hypothetical protein F4776DRAFT_675969 [Hypoxylon sp. NC0597]|nr:hypothetical protein F4776DRAFT_675969 [Hypoxylon sp. NC0597]